MKLLKEPLLHFVLLGAALFAGYRMLNPAPTASPDEIVVSAGQIDHLAATFSKTWQRSPSPEEMKELIDSYVREEMLAREAVKLGLDRDDTIIRRRLEQKMDFIIEDVGDTTKPTAADLQKFLVAHPDRFQTAPTYSLRQVFLNPAKHGDSLATDAASLLAKLKESGPDASAKEFGDPTLLSADFENEIRARMVANLGEKFTAALDTLPVGEWSGPVESGYGTHLVFLSAREPGKLPALAEVRAEVEREWSRDRREEIRQKYLDGLLSHYKVTIEQPAPSKPSIVRNP